MIKRCVFVPLCSIMFHYQTGCGSLRNPLDLFLDGKIDNCAAGTITNRAVLRLLIVRRDDY